MTGITDFHNHVMPGVDDGAQRSSDAVAALCAMREHGVEDVIASPHFDASLTDASAPYGAFALEKRLSDLDAGWARLRQAAADAGGITVHRGAELMLDSPEPDLSDRRLRLAGTRFVLVEFGFTTLPAWSTDVLMRLRAKGYLPIVGHPERYSGIAPGSILPLEWRRAGAFLQVNGPSLLGKYGKGAKAVAFDLLTRGLADYLSSDFHTRASPLIRDYRMWLVEHDGAEQAQRLTVDNPRRILKDEPPLPVEPLRRATAGWSRLLPWKR